MAKEVGPKEALMRQRRERAYADLLEATRKAKAKKRTLTQRKK